MGSISGYIWATIWMTVNPFSTRSAVSSLNPSGHFNRLQRHIHQVSPSQKKGVRRGVPGDGGGLSGRIGGLFTFLVCKDNTGTFVNKPQTDTFADTSGRL